jgi:hypothetical protein
MNFSSPPPSPDPLSPFDLFNTFVFEHGFSLYFDLVDIAY